MRKAIVTGLVFVGWFNMSSAQAEFTNAFDFFKSLKGSWSIQSGDRTLSIKMTYDLASKDTVVTEFFGKELSVFYPDGTNMMMTHFCNAGTHPRLKLKQNGTPAFFEFETIDVTNLNLQGDGAHVQGITYKLIEPGKLELKIVWKRREREDTEEYLLTREH